MRLLHVLFSPYCCSIMSANCSISYKNLRAGHRLPSSALATPPSLGNSTLSAAVLPPIWAWMHVQVCVPVYCQKNSTSQRERRSCRQAVHIQSHTRASTAELIQNPEIKGAVLALFAWQVTTSNVFEKSYQHQFDPIVTKIFTRMLKKFYFAVLEHFWAFLAGTYCFT